MLGIRPKRTKPRIIDSLTGVIIAHAEEINATPPGSNLRLGLCCIFRKAGIKFRTATARGVSRLTKSERERKIADLCRHNAQALGSAIEYCQSHGIGCFRINSQILPLKTHPDFGYSLANLPGGVEIIDLFVAAGKMATRMGVRLTMHPDQFVVLNSPRPSVLTSSLAELEYQAEFAEWTGVDVINIHGGGAYGDKEYALNRLASGVNRLSTAARNRLTLENDDRTYTPRELLSFCRQVGIPFVYDIHHHRCLPDGLTIEEVTHRARKTWHNREQLCHLSSPRDGWQAANPRYHHDYIDLDDIPKCWFELPMTIEIEAKAKELAVEKLRLALEGSKGK